MKTCAAISWRNRLDRESKCRGLRRVEIDDVAIIRLRHNFLFRPLHQPRLILTESLFTLLGLYSDMNQSFCTFQCICIRSHLTSLKGIFTLPSEDAGKSSVHCVISSESYYINMYRALTAFSAAAICHGLQSRTGSTIPRTLAKVPNPL